MERKSTTKMAFRQRRRRTESLSTPIQKCTPISRNPFLPVVTWSIRRAGRRSEEHTSELQSLRHLVCRLLLEKKKNREGQTVAWSVVDGEGENRGWGRPC